jgi:hypothetical protein
MLMQGKECQVIKSSTMMFAFSSDLLRLIQSQFLIIKYANIRQRQG